MLVVETLVSLVEHSLQCGPISVNYAFQLVLQSVGAGPETSRSAVADVLAESAAASVIRQFTCIPTDVRLDAVLEELAAWAVPTGVGEDSALGSSWPAAPGPGGAALRGFGMSRVVPLDALVAFVALVGGGTLDERARVAFWTLDRDGAGYLTLDQLLRFSGLLIAVSAAGRLVLGLSPLPRGNDPAAGAQAGSGAAGAFAGEGGAATGLTGGTSRMQSFTGPSGLGTAPAAGAAAAGAALSGGSATGAAAAGVLPASSSPLSSASRALIDAALLSAFQDHCLPADGPSGLQARLTAERLTRVVQSAAEHITMTVVQHATAASAKQHDGFGPAFSHSRSQSHSSPAHAHQSGRLNTSSPLTFAGGPYAHLANQGSRHFRPGGSNHHMNNHHHHHHSHPHSQHQLLHQQAGAGHNGAAPDSSLQASPDASTQLPHPQQHQSQWPLASLGGATGTGDSSTRSVRGSTSCFVPATSGAVPAPSPVPQQLQPQAGGLAAALRSDPVGAGPAGLQASDISTGPARAQSEGLDALPLFPSVQPPKPSAPFAPAMTTYSIWGWPWPRSSATTATAAPPAARAAGATAPPGPVAGASLLRRSSGAEGSADPHLQAAAVAGQGTAPPAGPSQGPAAAPPHHSQQPSQQQQQQQQRGTYGVWSIATYVGQAVYGAVVGGGGGSGPRAAAGAGAAGGGAGGVSHDSGKGTARLDAAGVPPAPAASAVELRVFSAAPEGPPGAGVSVKGLHRPGVSAAAAAGAMVKQGTSSPASATASLGEHPPPCPPGLSPTPCPDRLLHRGNEHPAAQVPAQSSVQPPLTASISAAVALPGSLGRSVAAARSMDRSATAAADAALAGAESDPSRGSPAPEPASLPLAGEQGRGGCSTASVPPQRERLSAGGAASAAAEGNGGATSTGGAAGTPKAATPPAPAAGAGGDGAACSSAIDAVLATGSGAGGGAGTAAAGPSAAGPSAAAAGSGEGIAFGGGGGRPRSGLLGRLGLMGGRKHGQAGAQSARTSTGGDPTGGGAAGAAGAHQAGTDHPLHPRDAQQPVAEEGPSVGRSQAVGSSTGRRPPLLLPALTSSNLDGGPPVQLLSPDPHLHASTRAPDSLDDAVKSAAEAAHREARAAVSRGGAPAAAAGGLAAATGGGLAAAAPAAAGSGTVLPPLQRAIRSSVQQAGVRLFLHCGLCLLSIIALLLTDAALVAWIYLDRKERLSLSLVIVAATNGGLVLLVLVISIVRSCMADRAAALEAAAAARRATGGQSGGGGGIAEFLFNNFVTPALRTMGVIRGPDDEAAAAPAGADAGGAGQGAGAPATGWGSRLRVLWTTIGRVAGFDSALMGADNTHEGRGTAMQRSISGGRDQMSYGYHSSAPRTGDFDAAGGVGALPAGAGAVGGPAPGGGGAAALMPGLGAAGAGGTATGYGTHALEGVAFGGAEPMAGGGGGTARPEVGISLGDERPRAGGQSGWPRTRGTALPGMFYDSVPTMRRVEQAYPAM